MNKNIVVLYKKTGTATVVKFLTDILEIKKMIIQGNLEMVRYENCIIVCNNKEFQKNKIPNIVLDLRHISGDCFLIGYNPKIKDFRSLTKKEIEFYKDALDRKSFQYDAYKKWTLKNNISPLSSNQDYWIEQEQTLENNSIPNSNNNFDNYEENQNTNSMINMILNIQAIILKCIKNISGEQ